MASGTTTTAAATGIELPDAVDAQAARDARAVLREVPDTGPTLALVSGGHDSLTAMHVVYQSERVDLDGIVHVNTGIGIPETREFVRQRARDLGLEYHEVGKPPADGVGTPEYRRAWETYEHLIQVYGFPGSAEGAHRWMYVNLKQKPLRRFLNDYADDVDGPITLVSGVRKHESDRRMENVAADGVQEYLGHTTVSPLVSFRGIDVRRYRTGLDLPMNPVVEKLEMSGECLCGAFADRGEMRMLRLFYPDVYRYLKCLETKLSVRSLTDDGPPEEYARWGHSRLKDHERDAMDDDGQMLLCDSCSGGSCEWE